MEEHKCDGPLSVVDARWELGIVWRELEECRAKLAELKRKEKRILLSLGEATVCEEVT